MILTWAFAGQFLSITAVGTTELVEVRKKILAAVNFISENMSFPCFILNAKEFAYHV